MKNILFDIFVFSLMFRHTLALKFKISKKYDDFILIFQTSINN